MIRIYRQKKQRYGEMHYKAYTLLYIKFGYVLETKNKFKTKTSMINKLALWIEIEETKKTRIRKAIFI